MPHAVAHGEPGSRLAARRHLVRFLLLPLGLSVSLFAGCAPAPPDEATTTRESPSPLAGGGAESIDWIEIEPPPAEPKAAEGTAATAGAASSAAGPSADDDFNASTDPLVALARRGHESWEAVKIQGMRVGYGKVAIRMTRDGDREVIRTDGLHHLNLRRFDQPIEQEIRLSTTETLDGRLLRFDSEINAGPTPMRVEGRTEGDRLIIDSTTAGQTVTKELTSAPGLGGFFGTELSLLRDPLKPGQRRKLKALLPLFNEVVIAHVELTAHDYEPVDLPSGTFQLLRIESRATMPGETVLTSTLWTDRTGDVIRSVVDAFGQESYRTTKELALGEPVDEDFDLFADLAVPLDEPLENPHGSESIRYRVELTGGDPASVFSVGPSQQVELLDEHTAEVTVYALRGDQAPPLDVAEAKPTEEDLAPNGMIQSDDPRIVAMAEEAAGDATDPWEVAQRLERYVHERIEAKNLSQAFATAADVAESLEGDCTEHAVLLAALARARDLPARVAIGLVYAPGMNGFLYHMWNEIYVDGRWIPLDATLGRGGIGAGHLKLSHSNLEGASAYSCFLPVAEVLGRLHVKVLEID